MWNIEYDKHELYFYDVCVSTGLIYWEVTKQWAEPQHTQVNTHINENTASDKEIPEKQLKNYYWIFTKIQA